MPLARARARVLRKALQDGGYEVVQAAAAPRAGGSAYVVDGMEASRVKPIIDAWELLR